MKTELLVWDYRLSSWTSPLTDYSTSDQIEGDFAIGSFIEYLETDDPEPSVYRVVGVNMSYVDQKNGENARLHLKRDRNHGWLVSPRLRTVYLRFIGGSSEKQRERARDDAQYITVYGDNLKIRPFDYQILANL